MIRSMAAADMSKNRLALCGQTQRDTMPPQWPLTAVGYV